MKSALFTTRAMLAATLAVAIVIGCGTGVDAAHTECVPGRSVSCDDDCGGVQTCDLSGHFQSCVCTRSDAGVESDAAVGPERWGKIFSGPAAAARSVAIDTSQNVVVGAEGQGIGIGLAKFSRFGELKWKKTMGDVFAVAVDAAANVYAVGNSPGGVDFGGGVVAASGGFVAKYDANGAFQWLLGPFSSLMLRAVATRPNGGVVVAGSLGGSVDLGGGILQPTGTRDALLLELTPFKTLVRQRKYGSAANSTFEALAMDGAGNTYLSGTFDGGAIAFGGPAVLLPSGSTSSIFIVKMDPSDGFLAQADGRAIDDDHVRSLAIGSGGKVWAAGQLGGRIQFGQALTPIGGQPNVWIAMFDSNLVETWSRRFGSPTRQWANGVTADPAGGAIVVGRTDGTLWMGEPGLPSSGGGWAARFDDGGRVVRNDAFASVGPNSTEAFGVVHAEGTKFVVVGHCQSDLGLPSGKEDCSTLGAQYVAKLDL